MTDKAPLVSVLVPSYNHERYILGCLESIKASDYENMELVLLDDGSSDKTYELAKEWIDANRSRFVRSLCKHQENAGICKTFNRLVSLSKGEYVSHIASDDQLTPLGISSQVAYAVKHDAGVVLSDCELINDDGALISSSALKYFRKTPLWLKSRSILDLDVLINWDAPYPHHFIKRTVFDELGGYNEDYLFEDVDFCLKALFQSRVVLYPYPTWRYRLRCLPNRVTPGLLKEDMQLDLMHIRKNNLLYAKGFNRLALKIHIMADNSNNAFIVQSFLAKVLRQVLRDFLKGLFFFLTVRVKIMDSCKALIKNMVCNETH